jgi:hypothetical protein
MATLTSATLIPLNDGNITVTGLALSGVPTAGATVTATLLDERGAIVSALENVSMLDVQGTPGNYSAFIAGTFTAASGFYLLKIIANKNGALFFTEQPVTVPFFSTTSPMPVGAFATVAALKQFAGKKPEDRTMDDLFFRLINRFGAYALNQCNRKSFLEADYSEKFNGNGGTRLSPKYAFATSPIAAIASLTVNGKAIPACPDDVRPGYAFDSFTIYLRGYNLSRGVQNISLTYSAGLDTIPVELEQACIDACIFWLNKRDYLGKSSVNVAGETVAFDKADLPETASMVLKQFTRRK